MAKDLNNAEIMNTFVLNGCNLGINALKKEFEDLNKQASNRNTFFKSEENSNRNRYKDVLCADQSRVVLTVNVPPETDYINANWVKFKDANRPFIVTQGPLESTAGDFWRMVYQVGQEAAPVIIMLCKCVENGIEKCFQYWPFKQASFRSYKNVTVTNKNTEQFDRFLAFTLEILPDGCSNSVITTLYQTSEWPDRGVPQNPVSIMRLLRHIRINELAAGPCIVHCSAGIGRSGTIIVLEIALQMIAKGKLPNVLDIVKKTRNQRPGAVKTAGQYIFIYACIFYYIYAKTNNHKELIMRFHESFVSSGLL